MKYADRDAMIEAVYAKTDLDMDLIDAMTDEQMRDFLELNRKPAAMIPANPEPVIVKQSKPRTVRSIPRIVSIDYVEQDGALFVARTFSDDSQSLVRAPDRVQFNGRTVSASIVLHWVRTGELVHRVPRAKKIRAMVRSGARMIHLGYFSTKEAADAAKRDAKFKLSLGLPIG